MFPGSPPDDWDSIDLHDEEVDGYLLRQSREDQPVTVHPCLGDKLSFKDTRLLVGTRYINHFELHPHPSKTLAAAEGSAHRVGAVSAGSDDPTVPLFQPPPTLDLELEESGVLNVTIQRETTAISPNSSKSVYDVTETIDVNEKAKEIVQSIEETSGESVELESIARELAAYYRGGASPTVGMKLTIVRHGQVSVGDHDLQELLESARRAIEYGPYERVEEAMEAFLEVVPDHVEADQMLVDANTLLEGGCEPGRLTLALEFADGAPTPEQIDVWKNLYPGYVRLVPLESPGPKRDYGGTFSNQTFTGGLPQGRYQMAVSVPGYKNAEQEVHIESDTRVSLQLNRETGE